CVQTIAFPFTF
nr:immunoglobulin light chain junction region [Macaca mulatta]MOW40980.1 immunoglobulin light chain junction region [Macaca mulatta]